MKNSIRSFQFFITLTFLVIQSSSAQQVYLDPILKTRPTGEIPENVAKLKHVATFGNSAFTVPNQAWSSIYSPKGDHVLIGGYNYLGCFNQKTGERIWGTFIVEKPEYEVGNPVRAIKVDASQNFVLLGCDHGLVKILDFKTGQTLRVLASDLGWVMDVDISPNGKLAAATDIQGKVRLWELKNGESKRLPPQAATRGEAVKFSPDNTKLAFGKSDGVAVFDLNKQDCELYPTKSTVQSILFINENEILVSGWEGFLNWIELNSHEVRWTTSIENWLINLRMLPDRSGALAISPFSVYLINWKSRSLTDLKISVRTAMDIHPDGKTLLTLNQFSNAVNQVNWKNKQAVFPRNEIMSPPGKLCFSPNGKYLASGSYFHSGIISFWDILHLKKLGSVNHQSEHGVDAFGFDGESEFFSFTLRQNNTNNAIADLPTCYSMPDLKPSKKNKGFQKNYLHCATNLESIETVFLKKEIPLRISAYFERLDDSMNRHLFGGWNLDKSQFAGITNENIAYIFDSKTGEKLAGVLLDQFIPVSIAIHPKSEMIAVGSWDGLIYLYTWEK